ncbi:MAG TPA: ATP-binding cassette domain-containing protein [Beijerinckiaceae bacterium]|nr:ATP-binding cassette domain-containing protein [Beijerinckiaceae bacterium]
MTDPLIALDQASKTFERRIDLAGRIANVFGAGLKDIRLQAVDRVDLSVSKGEIVGLVGESGCGKSTVGRLVAGIHSPSAGRVLWRGMDVASLDDAGRRACTLGIQMIFQDPMASLNPRMRAGDIVAEAALVHGLFGADEREERVAAAFSRVGLDPSYARRYPHQFSGGQRARIGIARALAVEPEVLVCDESVAALDVSIQAQVLNLFMDLGEQLGLSYLFISHDLGVVRHIASRVIIMYLGRVVETARTEALFDAPAHPYTRALLDNVPRLDARHRSFATIKGEIPSPINPPPGCHFHPRCPLVGPRCRAEVPALKAGPHGGTVACHLNDGGTA